jgi:uncharacterized Zn finger protein (UPF0148 family)
MKLLSLTCQHCGAPLEVPAKITQLTCQFCGTRLKVQRTGSAAYTETLEEVAQQVARVADNTDQLKLEQEIARLDREWMMRRDQFMVRRKNGQLDVPTRTSAAIGGAIVVVFGLFWTFMAFGVAAGADGVRGAPIAVFDCFPFFGVVFIIGGIVMAVTAYGKAINFDEHQHAYQAERNRLLNELRVAGQSTTESDAE